MTSDSLDNAFWGLPLVYVETAADAKSLDVAFWGLPMSTNLIEGNYYLLGGF